MAEGLGVLLVLFRDFLDLRLQLLHLARSERLLLAQREHAGADQHGQQDDRQAIIEGDVPLEEVEDVLHGNGDPPEPSVKHRFSEPVLAEQRRAFRPREDLVGMRDFFARLERPRHGNQAARRIRGLGEVLLDVADANRVRAREPGARLAGQLLGDQHRGEVLGVDADVRQLVFFVLDFHAPIIFRDFRAADHVRYLGVLRDQHVAQTVEPPSRADLICIPCPLDRQAGWAVELVGNLVLALADIAERDFQFEVIRSVVGLVRRARVDFRQSIGLDRLQAKSGQRAAEDGLLDRRGNHFPARLAQGHAVEFGADRSIPRNNRLALVRANRREAALVKIGQLLLVDLVKRQQKRKRIIAFRPGNGHWRTPQHRVGRLLLALADIADGHGLARPRRRQGLDQRAVTGHAATIDRGDQVAHVKSRLFGRRSFAHDLNRAAFAAKPRVEGNMAEIAGSIVDVAITRTVQLGPNHRRAATGQRHQQPVGACRVRRADRDQLLRQLRRRLGHGRFSLRRRRLLLLFGGFLGLALGRLGGFVRIRFRLGAILERRLRRHRLRWTEFCRHVTMEQQNADRKSNKQQGTLEHSVVGPRLHQLIPDWGGCRLDVGRLADPC